MILFPVTKTYDIDLRLPESERWRHVIEAESDAASELMREAAMVSLGYDPVSGGRGFWGKNAAKMLHAGYRFSGGHFLGEIDAWAKGVGISAAEATFLNCQYELSHLFERSLALGRKVPDWLRNIVAPGCTAGALRLGDGRVIHVRNMDWPLEALTDATRIFRFREGRRRYHAVGMPGFVGALSGMVPGAYSATINYAPPTFTPGFDFGPLFLLRHVFETCDTYDDACYALSHTRISANVLFLVCSADGRASVIERTRQDFARVPMRGGVITVANHYRSGKFRRENEGWDPDVILGSKDRASTLSAELKGLGSRASLAKAARMLEEEPVFNEETRQLMAFDPARGKLLAWTADPTCNF